MVFSLGLRRENSEERNDEVDAQVRLKIGVRLAASIRRQRLICQIHAWWLLDVHLEGGILPENVVLGRVGINQRCGNQKRMTVRGGLTHSEGHLFEAAVLSQDKTAALVDRQATAQVWQREG